MYAHVWKYVRSVTCEYVGHGHLEQNWLQRNLFEKRFHNAWLFKALCYTMSMHTSYNMPTEHMWFCWSSKAKLIAKPNMYKFFIVFEKKWEKNVIKKLMLEFSKGWYITSSLFSNLDLYAFCLNSGSICTRLNVRL